MSAPPFESADLALVRACAAGDPNAWAAFLKRWRPFILQVARAAMGGDCEPLADDVTGDVLAQLLAKNRATLRSYEGRSSLRAWLVVLTRRASSKALRTERKQSGRLPMPSQVLGQGPSPSHLARASENRSWVQSGLGKLPAKDCLALRLFYEHGKTYREISRVLGVPEGHVPSLMTRARGKLQKLLRERRREDRRVG